MILACFLFAMLSVGSARAGRWWDDFEDGNLHNWEVFNYAPRVEKWEIKRGEAIGEIFELGSMSLLVAGEDTWENYTVRCRAKFDKVLEDGGSLGISIYEDGEQDNRFLFSLNIGVGMMRIWHVQEGDWGGPVAIPFEPEMDTWYQLEAAISGEQLFFRVGEEVLAAVSREPLPPGKFALVVSNARAHFDDVEVEGDDIPNFGPEGFAVEPSGRLGMLWSEVKQGKR